MPKVIFVTADQFRGDCLSVLGHPDVRTPNLDSLAAEGVCFARNFAQAAPCGPSRACMHTSTYLSHNRSWRNGVPIASGVPNWAEVCAEAGLHSVLFGYTHTASQVTEAARKRGFEGILPGVEVEAEFRNDLIDWHRWMQDRGMNAPRLPWQLGEPRPGSAQQAGTVTWGTAQYDAKACDASYLVDRTIDYLRQSPKQNEVVHLSIFSPHDPYLVPHDFSIRRSVSPVALMGHRTQAEEAGVHPFLAWFLQGSGLGYKGSQEQLADMREHYFARIEALDLALGRLFDFLRGLSTWNETLVIFTSDHGDQLGDHHLVGKGGFFDESYHVPLIVRAPSGSASHAPGTVVQQLTQTIDIAPTILEFLGIAAPHSFRGHSLLRAGSSRPHHVFFEYDFSDAAKAIPSLRGRKLALRGIRDERWTYVDFAGAFAPLLIDNVTSDGAFRDQRSAPEQRDIVARMMGLMEKAFV